STFVMLIAAALYGLGFGSVQPALQAWAVDKSPDNRKGMANATFFSFFDLGIGIGAMVFGQLASLYGYHAIYLTAAGSVMLSDRSTFVMLIAAALYGLGFGSVQPALQAWAVDKSPDNRKGMANATFFSFFDLGIGIGAMVFGQLASLYGYHAIYLTAAGSVML